MKGMFWMDSQTAFHDLGRRIETDPFDIQLAQCRRAWMVSALMRGPGVLAVIETGSLARGTTVGPVHDIDLVVVLDPDVHPGPSLESGSADASLTALASLLDASGLVRNTKPRNHVVKCDMGVPLDYVDFFSPPFRPDPPVDVMPAFRSPWAAPGETSIVVPERRNDTWVTVDPELLVGLVEERQREWQYFKPVIRMVKTWAAKHQPQLNSALIEALVLKYMPRPGYFGTLTYGDALQKFFEQASGQDLTLLPWPLPGNVDAQLGFAGLGAEAALAQAATWSREAMAAEVAGLPAGEHWRKIFGPAYVDEDILDWLLGAPPVSNHTRPEMESWYDWLLRCFARRTAEMESSPAAAVPVALVADVPNLSTPSEPIYPATKPEPGTRGDRPRPDDTKQRWWERAAEPECGHQSERLRSFG